MITYPFHFPKIQAIFIQRLNRFVVQVKINNRYYKAYLPNPGRLWEILIPKEKLLLIPNKNKKIPYTVLAGFKNNIPVLLHTHLTNHIIYYLIKHKKLPFWQNFYPEKMEKKFLNSRFDLYLKSETEKMIVEVKTCTLFGNKIAMFPDAVTQRGSKHLLELEKLTQKGYRTSVLFVIMNPQIKYFLPAYHIDYDFFQTFMKVSKTVELRAIALKWDKNFSEIQDVKEVPIPYKFLKNVKDKGAYLLILKAEKDQNISVGKLGNLFFKRGYYVYVGSALNNLSKRIARHKKKKKKKRWHIDYIREHFSIFQIIPVRTDKKIECEIANRLGKISEGIRYFGASDCFCYSHLFYFKENPLFNKNFQKIIIDFRINFLEKCLEN